MANRWASKPLAKTVTPSFLIGAGLVAAATFVAVILTEARLADATFAGRLVELLMLGVPAVGLVYAGYWLTVAEFDPDRVRHIGRFGVAGAVVGFVATALLVGLSAVTLPDATATFALFVATGTEGSLLGVLVGSFAATDALFRRERDAAAEFEMLHGMLRHNVRNRLTIIGGHLTFLAESGTADDDDAVATIEAQLAAIESLLEDTRLATEAVGAPATTEPVDLAAVVREQLALLEASYDGLSVATDLPEGATVAGGDLLAAAVENVLTNAVVHHDRSTVDLAVRLSVSGDAVRLRVADDGPGIPAARHEEVFEAGTGEGTGMGLYLVRSVVDRYGGAIELGEHEPRGTVVTMTLPRADP